MKYWVSWWSPSKEVDEMYETECVAPFKWWSSGATLNNDFTYKNQSICAVVQMFGALDDEETIWQLIGKYFTVLEKRFCKVKPDDWKPGDRFE